VYGSEVREIDPHTTTYNEEEGNVSPLSLGQPGSPSEETPSSPEGPLGLTFADGFQFGCGFMLAVVLSMVILTLAVIALVLFLSLVGLSLAL